MSWAMIKKLDKESMKNLMDGKGPCDLCVCSILKEMRATGVKACLRRCFGSKKGKKGRKKATAGKSAKGSKPGKGKGSSSSSSSRSSKSGKSKGSNKCPK